VLKLSQTNSHLEAERTQLQQQLTELRSQNEDLVLANSSKMPVDEHINALAAVKQYVFTL